VTWIRRHWPRLVAGLAQVAVAAVTGVISYSHIYRLTLVLHQPVLVARLMPFGVDGLIVVGSVVLLQATRDHPRLGWLGVGPGMAISLFANVESGLPFGWLAAAWAGVPALAFSLATFMLERWLKGQSGPPAATPGQCPHLVASTAAEAVVQAYLHERDCLDGQPSQRQLAAGFGISRPKVAELVSPLNGHAPGS
jgi:hypothetical protein